MFDLFEKSDYFCIEVQKENVMKAYTEKELLESAEEGRQQIAMGKYTDIDDMFRELDEELQLEAV